jgi:hypothetical protein
MRRKAVLVLALVAALLAVYAVVATWSTITLELEPNQERLAVCGEYHITECSDRWEYAVGAFFTAVSATLAVGFGALAYIVGRAGRTGFVPWLVLVSTGRHDRGRNRCFLGHAIHLRVGERMSEFRNSLLRRAPAPRDCGEPSTR